MRRSRLRLHITRALSGIAASGLAMMLLLAAPGETRAGGCTFVAAVDPAPGSTGSSSVSAAVGEEITFWGTFIPGAQVDLTFMDGGVPYGDFTPAIADAEGDILFVFDFQPGQEGAWTVTAGVAGTECAGTVAVMVTAASGEPTVAPSPSGMSNTATYVAQPRGAPDSVLLTVAVVVVLAAGVMLVRRPH